MFKVTSVFIVQVQWHASDRNINDSRYIFSYVAVSPLYVLCGLLYMFISLLNSLNRMRKSAFRFTSDHSYIWSFLSHSPRCAADSFRPLVGHIKSAFSWSTRKDVLWISWILNWNLTRIDRKFVFCWGVLHCTHIVIVSNACVACEYGELERNKNRHKIFNFFYRENIILEILLVLYWLVETRMKATRRTKFLRCAWKIKMSLDSLAVWCGMMAMALCVPVPCKRTKNQKPNNQTSLHETENGPQ